MGIRVGLQDGCHALGVTFGIFGFEKGDHVLGEAKAHNRFRARRRDLGVLPEIRSQFGNVGIVYLAFRPLRQLFGCQGSVV